jgi:SAM-dependent methyltransferase
MSLLTRFFAANRALSGAVEARLPEPFKRHPHTLYKFQVAGAVNRRPRQIVLDVGGGKECPFLPYVDDRRAHLIVALDASEEELRRNRLLQDRVVADAAAHGFPLRDGCVDLVVSRAVVEHIRDNSAMFESCARVLRPGGTMIHAFPGRFAPFALINQVLPNSLVRRLIRYFLPDWAEGENYGFLAFYNRCYFSAVKEELARNNFVNAQYTLTYYQSLYFTSFFPMYLVMLAYDLVAWGSGIRNLASGILVTAERPAEPAPSRVDLGERRLPVAMAKSGEPQRAHAGLPQSGGGSMPAPVPPAYGAVR